MERLFDKVESEPKQGPTSVLDGLESVYGYSNIGEYLVKRVETSRLSEKINTIVVMGAPGVSKTTFLSEISQRLEGKLLAVFFDDAFRRTEIELGPRVELQKQGRVGEYWQAVNEKIYGDYKQVVEATKKKGFKSYTRGLELVCIGTEEHDRGITALKNLMPTRTRSVHFFVVAIAPEEAKEGRITTQTQATLIRGIVEKSIGPEEVVDNLLSAGTKIKNINPNWTKKELGLRLKAVVAKMATENQIIALNQEIEKSVSELTNDDLVHIKSLIPEKFHNSPHVLHLMYILKLRIRVPENHYALVFNPYNKNLQPQIDLGFLNQTLH